MALGEMMDLSPGAEVFPTGEIHQVPVSDAMCGRVLDALGNPIDDKGPIVPDQYYPSQGKPPHPLKRQLILKKLETGVKAIDSTCTTGLGQRMGIFSGAGVGKSTLLGMISRMSTADINVIALIGERGREVREFLERDLGPRGLSKSILIVATSDQPALLRSKGALTATAIAEYFRNQGKNVVFLMDSITRYATALREIGLAIGEPPTTKGFPPSVFATLPKLLERTGSGETGVITGFYTILAEGDDLNDPVADHVRAILDGHIVLSRKLANANHFPAIDVLESLSRVMNTITTPTEYQRASKLRDLLQTYKEAEDLIHIGAYSRGSNPNIDQAIDLMPRIRDFLKQDYQEAYSFLETEHILQHIIGF
jgi:flagellum-specific ATP synthase